ncbi:MAG: hypothetical protein AAFY43_06345 [Pseudomonadota bacterium]
MRCVNCKSVVAPGPVACPSCHGTLALTFSDVVRAMGGGAGSIARGVIGRVASLALVAGVIAGGSQLNGERIETVQQAVFSSPANPLPHLMAAQVVDEPVQILDSPSSEPIDLAITPASARTGALPAQSSFTCIVTCALGQYDPVTFTVRRNVPDTGEGALAAAAGLAEQTDELCAVSGGMPSDVAPVCMPVTASEQDT